MNHVLKLPAFPPTTKGKKRFESPFPITNKSYIHLRGFLFSGIWFQLSSTTSKSIHKKCGDSHDDRQNSDHRRNHYYFNTVIGSGNPAEKSSKDGSVVSLACDKQNPIPR
jgi:hypothetical protein